MKRIVRILIVAPILFFSLSVHAQRTIDFTQQLTGLDGKTINGPNNKPVTLSDVAVGALLSNFQSDQNLSGSEKLGLWDLAHKVKDNKSCALSVDEMKTIMDRIGKAYNTVVVGPALHLLDPNAHGEPVKAEPEKK